MDLDLEPIVKVRTYEEVVRRLQDQILDGRLKAGDRLPGERELSERLGVSRATVREALRVLETLQIVRISGRSGPEGGSVVEGHPGDVMARLLTLQLALSQYSMTEFVQARCAIESASAALAAEGASAEQLDQLERILVAMEEGGIDKPASNELDTDFHTAIGDASGNLLLAQLMRAIRGAMRQEMMQGFEEVEDWDSMRERLHREHRQILDAIRAGDAEAARAAVDRHLMEFEPRWIAHRRGAGAASSPDGARDTPR